MTRERYRIHDLIVDVGAVRVTRDDQPIALPPLSFALLVALARRAPDVVTAETLINDVWRGTAVADETLTQRVRLLRKSLGDNATRPRYVRSVRGHGYQLACPATTENDALNGALPAIPPDGDPEVSTTVAGTSGRPSIDDRPSQSELARTRPVYGLVVLALVAAGAITAFGVTRLGDHESRAHDPAPRALVATTPVGIDELLERADTYRARHLDEANELAIELYERVLETSPDDTRAQVGLSFGLVQRSTKFNRGAEHAKQATAIAQDVLARDPDHADAHHALALSFDAMGRLSDALASYERALTFDPTLIRARASRAYALQISGRLVEALHENLAALEMGPSNAPYLELQTGTTLALLGFPETAESWLERAVTLRPDSVFAALGFARVRLSEGRMDDADHLASAAVARGIVRPELSVLRGEVALAKRNVSSARQHFADARQIRPHDFAATTRELALERLQGEHEALTSRYHAQLAVVRAARGEGDESSDATYDAMILHTVFGERDAAIEALDVAIALGFRDVGRLRHDPWLTTLRDHPPFVQRVERLRDTLADERHRVRNADWLPPAFLARNERSPS